MQLIVYILVYPLIWCISILPFRVLYFFSDLLYLFIFYVIGYRKKVVQKNLEIAFPEISKKELKRIQKKFYHHFVDIFMEMIKSFTIKKERLDKHYKYTNADLLNNLYKNGKSVMLVGAHYANWEWIVGLNSFVDYKCVGAFTNINNKYINRKILKTREKFGVELVKTQKVISKIHQYHQKDIQAMYGFLSDQSPQLKKTHYWSYFFGVNVPIHTGAEMLAKKYDMNVVYMDTQKIKRGYYETTFSLITDNPKEFQDYQITDMFLKKVEEIVYKKPEYYFWTHNRFKHKDKYQEYLESKNAPI